MTDELDPKILEFLNSLITQSSPRTPWIKRRSVVYGAIGFLVGVIILLFGAWFDARVLLIHAENSNLFGLKFTSLLHTVVLMLPIIFLLAGVLFGRLADAEHLLISQRDFWFNFVNVLGQGVCYNDHEGTIRFVNKKYADMLGITPQEMIGRRTKEFVHPDDQGVLTAIWHERQTGQSGSHSYRMKYGDKELEVLVTGVPWFNQNQFQGSVAIVQDVTTERQIQRQTNYEHQFMQKLLDTADALVIVCYPDGKIHTFNHACQQLTGLSTNQVVGTLLWDTLILPDDQGELQDIFKAIGAQQAIIHLEHDWQLLNGEIRQIEWTYTSLITEPTVYIVGTGIDVTEQRRMERKNQQLILRLHQLATTDAVTNIANRHQLGEMGEMYASMASEDAPLSVLIIDIDHFKRVNDSYGHSVGDDVLRHLAQQFRHMTRSNDIVGRFGGEEFMILSPATPMAAAHRIAERARTMVADTPISTDGGVVRLTISIGVCSYTAPTTFENLLKTADEALYKAKAQGRNCVVCADA